MHPPVVLQLKGGLGNQLFMFATAYSLTRRWGRELQLSDSWFRGRQRGSKFREFAREFHLHRFPRVAQGFARPSTLRGLLLLSASRVPYRLQLCPERYLYIESKLGFDERLVEHPTRNLVGYFQSEEYFAEYRSDLLWLLDLDPGLSMKMEKSFDRIAKGASRVAMLHVRRDDALVDGNQWIGVLDPMYFTRAIHDYLPDASCVLVFSDSPEWCRAQQAFKEFTIVDEPDPVVTLMLMRKCDDFVLSASTLGWWGAWLSTNPSKRVFVPRPLHRYTGKMTQEGLIPNTWRQLPALWQS